MTKSNYYKKQFLTMAVGAGTVSTFGAPYGGVLFGIEVTGSIYLVSTLFKSFACGGLAFLIYKTFNPDGFLSDPAKQAPVNTKETNWLHFIIVGVITGHLGGLLTMVTGKFNEMKGKSSFEVFKK
jgi:H+/Cl- antiporter ClcA